MEDKIIFGFKKNDKLRKSFNDLSKISFNTDFEEWYNKGLWEDIYEPYSIIRDGKIIANASIHKLKLLVNGELKSAVQFGTVMTDEKFREQGLSRQLMEHIIEKYRYETDIFYLFANETVLDFYPRFGFKTRDQYQLSTTDQNPVNDKYNFRKLNMDDPADISILKRIAKSRITNSKTFDVIDGHEILCF